MPEELVTVSWGVPSNVDASAHMYGDSQTPCLGVCPSEINNGTQRTRYKPSMTVGCSENSNQLEKNIPTFCNIQECGLELTPVELVSCGVATGYPAVLSLQ